MNYERLTKILRETEKTINHLGYETEAAFDRLALILRDMEIPEDKNKEFGKVFETLDEIRWALQHLYFLESDEDKITEENFDTKMGFMEEDIERARLSTNINFKTNNLDFMDWRENNPAPENFFGDHTEWRDRWIEHEKNLLKERGGA